MTAVGVEGLSDVKQRVNCGCVQSRDISSSPGRLCRLSDGGKNMKIFNLSLAQKLPILARVAQTLNKPHSVAMRSSQSCTTARSDFYTTSAIIKPIF